MKKSLKIERSSGISILSRLKLQFMIKSQEFGELKVFET